MLKNITLSADAALIESARLKAREEGTTLNETFRRWLLDYVRPDVDLAEVEAAAQQMRAATAGIVVGKLTRDEMNERR